MGDPHAVVFHLPEGTGEDPSLSSSVTEVTTNTELGASDILVKQIMLQMRGYLVDNDVEIIELTSKTLKVFIPLVCCFCFGISRLFHFFWLIKETKTYLFHCNHPPDVLVQGRNCSSSNSHCG